MPERVAKLEQRILRALELTASQTPIRLLAPALVAAARCAADVAALEMDPERACTDRATLEDVARDAGLRDQCRRQDVYLAAHRHTFEAELARISHEARSEDWSRVAALWDGLERPHDAAYARWRAAQCALREGQGTIALRLLKRAAADAREHVPLSQAIARTAAGAR